jgi:hypothetical protein
MTEFLVLPDGKVLVQNLTPVMAAILLDLNPNEPAIRRRVLTAPLLMRQSRLADRAVPPRPRQGRATLAPLPMPDGGQRSARPAFSSPPMTAALPLAQPTPADQPAPPQTEV